MINELIPRADEGKRVRDLHELKEILEATRKSYE